MVEKQCKRCKGRGTIIVKDDRPRTMGLIQVLCPICEGSGYILETFP